MAANVDHPKSNKALIVQGQPVVGFDLGTTFSKAAYIDTEFQPRLVPLGNPQSRGDDRFQIPSVALLRSDKLLTGDELPASFDPEDIPIRLPKRFLADTRPRFPENNPRFSAAEICGQILKRLKIRTELFIGLPVKRVVLTVPPSFGSRQRQAILQAAAWAELEVLDLVEEPVAAAVYDWMVERIPKPGENRPLLGVKYSDIRAGSDNMLVFDLGGGTLDISLLNAEGMNVQVLESWAGGEFLGGADFTKSIADWIAAEIRGRTGFDPVYHLNARDKVYQAAESMKREMTTTEKSRRYWKERDLQLDLTLEKYNRVVEPLLSRAQTAIYQAAQSAEKQLSKPVKRLLIVGAGSRARGVQAMLDTLDSKRVGSHEMPADGSFWVSLGAAATAWLTLQNPTDRISDEGKSHKIFQLKRKSTLNLGIVAWDSAKSDYSMRVVIKSNAQLPAEKTVSFGKVKYNQPKIRLRVVESPTKLLGDSKSVGEFLIETDKGIDDHLELKYQTEVPKDQDPDRDDELKVTLSYDITGRVRVSVLDRRTSKRISKMIDPEPVNTDFAEDQIANSALVKPPATATADDDVKRLRRQIMQLRAELKQASQVTPPNIQIAERLSVEELQYELDPPSSIIQKVEKFAPIDKPAPPPVPKRVSTVQDPELDLEIDLDLPDDDFFSNRPMQTVFDDDSVVIDALSGSNIAKAPAVPQSTIQEDDNDLFIDDSVVLDLGVSLRMNDNRLVGLSYSMKLILLELMKEQSWTWDQFSALCNSQQSQPKFVFERLNQWSESKYREYLLTRDNQNLNIKRELLT